MSEKVQKNDFIELDYTGRLESGEVFDTTLKKVAEENDLPTEKTEFVPAKICVGEGQILPGLDQELIEKEIGETYTVKIAPENAFGKRDVKKIKMVPISTFKEHNVAPQPGLQIDVDGEMGTVMRVAGGRIMVNFNHPLAGREVAYEFIINKKITDTKEQIVSFINTVLRVPEDKIKVEIKEEKAEISLPLQLPPQFLEAIEKKLAELVKSKEVKFKVAEIERS